MALTQHPTGDYSFLPGIAPYSCGVVANAGFEVVQVTFDNLVPVDSGFDLIAAQLATWKRPLTALCAIALRVPRPFTFDGFANFNSLYAETLKNWGVFVQGVNPVARTNVAPERDAPAVASMFGFAFTRPSPTTCKTFVVAGAGELPEGVLNRQGIVELGNTSPAGMAGKATFVMDLMERRLFGLGASWRDVTTVNVYTAHSLTPLLPEIVLGRMGPASLRGVRWHFSRPPIEEIEYEMDMRGTMTELRM